MKILVIGDLHGKLPKKIPKADLNLCTGDVGSAEQRKKISFDYLQDSSLKEKLSDSVLQRAIKETENSTLDILRQIGELAPTYLVYGNVESTPAFPWQYEFYNKIVGLDKKISSIENVNLLNNCKTEINGIKIGGLEFYQPLEWVEDFEPKGIEHRLERIKKKTIEAEKILNDFGNLDILLCHQPPYGYLDKVNFSGMPKNWKGKHLGSKAVLNYIKKFQPRYVFCGHIHEGKGHAKIGKTEVYNVGCNGDYIFIDINKNP